MSNLAAAKCNLTTMMDDEVRLVVFDTAAGAPFRETGTYVRYGPLSLGRRFPEIQSPLPSTKNI